MLQYVWLTRSFIRFKMNFKWGVNGEEIIKILIDIKKSTKLSSSFSTIEDKGYETVDSLYSNEVYVQVCPTNKKS